MDLFFILKPKLDPPVPVLLWTSSFTYTVCYWYLSGLVPKAHRCLLRQRNTAVPQLPSSGGMPMALVGQHRFAALTALPTATRQFCSIQVAGTGASPDPVSLTSHASKDGHIPQKTLSDQGSADRRVYDPSSANHSSSVTSWSYFWSHHPSATVTKLAGQKSSAANVICVPTWGQPAGEWRQSRNVQSWDMERVKISSEPWVQICLKPFSTIPSDKSQQMTKEQANLTEIPSITTYRKTLRMFPILDYLNQRILCNTASLSNLQWISK